MSFLKKSAISSLVANLAGANLNTKLSTVELLNSWVIMYLG